MNNLRKYLAIIVTLALMLGTVMHSAAADPAVLDTAGMSDAEICSRLGIITGDGNGISTEYLAQAPTRIQAAVLFLRLKGLETTAMTFKGTENFSDADKAEWAKPVMAYLKATGATVGFQGYPDGTFEPLKVIGASEYYKIMLVALGYTEDVGKGGDFKFEDVLKFADAKGLKKAANITGFTMKDLASATVEALSVKVNGSTKTLIEILTDSKIIDPSKAKTAGLIKGEETEKPVKIAKIEMVSRTILQRSATEGVAYYKVTDQGGNDITNSAQAANIAWNCISGKDAVTGKNGVLTFTSFNGAKMLNNQKFSIVTAYDPDSRISTTASLVIADKDAGPAADSSEVHEFILIEPKDDIIAGSNKIVMLYIAIDKKGDAITDYSQIAGKVVFQGIDPGNIEEVKNADGSYTLLMNFPEKKQYIISTTVKTSSVFRMNTAKISAN